MIKHLAAIVLALPLGAALAGDAAILIPPPEQILATLKPGHPRLFASKHEFGLIQTNPLRPVPEWRDKLRERGDKLLTEPPAKYEIPDGLRLLSVSRSVLLRIQTLALLFHITDNKAYAERAWKELETVAAFQDWNPRHFLDTAEMAHAFAIGYDWLYDELNPAQRKIVREALIEKALKPAQGVYRGTAKYSAFHKSRHNWNQVCNGGIGIGALAIADEEPNLAGEILNRATETIQLAMREYGPDGAWAEGPGYWNYATTYNVAFLAALETALGTDFGLSKIEGFDRAGDFPICLTGPLGRTFNYADGGDGTIRSPAMYWLAQKFYRPHYAAYEDDFGSGHPMDLVWHWRSAAMGNSKSFGYFRNAEIVTMRALNAQDLRDTLFVGFKAGDNKANHSNLDLGTFVLDALGIRWALDLGADNYNLPGYFGKQRWTYYRMRAEGHNTVVIDPSPEPDQLPTAAARIDLYRYEPKRAIAVTDLSAAYAKSGSKVRRGIAMLDREQVLVQDEIQCPKNSDVWWFMHTAAEVELSETGTSALLLQDGKKLAATILSPLDARFSVRNAEPLPDSVHPEKQNLNQGIRKLAIHLPQTRETRIAVLLTPVFHAERPPHPALAPLEQW